MYLGMGLPGQRAKDAPEEKVLIWGAGGAVGGYAVQYAKSVGYTGQCSAVNQAVMSANTQIVIATASPRGFDHLKKIGASEVLDYKDADVVEELRKMGPFKYMYTTSGDSASQQALASLLGPEGGKFASTLGGDVELPKNVERVYEFFGNVTLKEGPQFEDFAHWWYGYLGKVIVDGSIEPTSFNEVKGGLAAIQKAADDMLDGKIKGKPVINPQE